MLDNISQFFYDSMKKRTIKAKNVALSRIDTFACVYSKTKVRKKTILIFKYFFKKTKICFKFSKTKKNKLKIKIKKVNHLKKQKNSLKIKSVLEV